MKPFMYFILISLKIEFVNSYRDINILQIEIEDRNNVI